jgi:outer membrane protein TolC
MKKTIFSALLMALAIGSGAQTSSTEISRVLAEVEQHNATLQALQASGEADKLAARTGIFLEGPEAEYSRLWGAPTAIGSRTDVSVTQSLDLLTLTGRRSRVARSQAGVIDAQFATERRAILLQASLCTIDIIYYNARSAQLAQRREQLSTLMQSAQRALDAGEGTALDVNNVALEVAAIDAEIAADEAQRLAAEAELTQLNGGEPLAVTAAEFDTEALPADFEQWCEAVADRSPQVRAALSQVELSQSELSLNKAAWLPTIKAGYMSEKTLGEHYQGLTVGMQIPLWSNRNRIKQAQAQVAAARLQADDSRAQLVASLRAQYQRAAGLQRAAELYDRALAENQGPALLRKALDHGQISMAEYLLQMERFYNASTAALSARRDLAAARATLSSIEKEN